jgi:glycosyltransferase involved in cell wall biosynthesis
MKEHTIKNRDIVLFSLQPWDEEIGSNFKDIALELSRTNRVLYINRALDRISSITKRNEKKVRSRLKSIWQGKGELNEVHPNLWVHNPRTVVESINWLPPGGAYNFLSLLNSKRLAKEINKVIRRLHFKDFILINDNDFFRGVHLKELVNCGIYIFYVRDYLTYQPWFRKHGERMEQRMMEVADIVVANSAYLANYSRKFNPRSYDIGQGCDVQSYLVESPSIPADMKDIPSPIIGYAGAISGTRLDEKVIEHIAAELPDCSVVMVGPVMDGFDAEALKRFKNVFFLGRKDPSAIPAYVYQFDICINPQQVNQLTIGNYPRKADEYLAMGKPMVATRTDAMEMFADYVFLCNSKEEYVSHIRKILENPELRIGEIKQQRQSFALTHTWEYSVGKLGIILSEYERKEGKYAELGQA